MAEARDPKAIRDQRDTENPVLEALQVQRRKALEKLRAALEREILLQKLWAQIDGDAHHFE